MSIRTSPAAAATPGELLRASGLTATDICIPAATAGDLPAAGGGLPAGLLLVSALGGGTVYTLLLVLLPSRLAGLRPGRDPRAGFATPTGQTRLLRARRDVYKGFITHTLRSRHA